MLIRTPLEKLRAFAESIDYTMKLDPSVVKRKIETGDPELNIAGRVIEHRPDITPLEPYQFIYGKYSTKVDESIYWRPEGSTNPFRSMIRLKLSTVMLESRVPDGSQNLKIRRYLRSGKLKACFPLHDRVRTEILQNKWMDYPFRGSQPFHEIKDYFGEKIALYFQFMSHYTEFLAIPAFVGIPMQIAVFATNDFSGNYPAVNVND